MNAAPLTVAQALTEATSRGLPRTEAQWLLCAVLDQTRAWLITHDDDLLSAADQARWQRWLAQRLDAVPLAYLTGRREFFGLPLQVTPDVLDPRPDTEILVEWALETLRDAPAGAGVLDLGTGSGAIALGVQHARPDLRVTGVDASEPALAVARANGQRLGLPVRWLQGSWFEPVAGEQFWLVVSNPPYLAPDDPHLPALRHEPRSALVAAGAGLADLAHLVQQAPAHLVPGGWLLLEHGHDQGEAVARHMHQAGWLGVTHRQDLAGHVRCTGGHVSALRERA